MAEDVNKNNSTEETKKDMAKVYGISLSDIEEVILPNGKEYFKFYNPEERTVRMIENRKDSGNLSEQFKAAQATISASQSENERQNARAVFDYQLRYQNIELTLIPISELKGNRLAYKHLFDSLDATKKKEIRVLIENMDYLELSYINIPQAIAIDKNNKVITSNYNAVTNECDLIAAEVKNYDKNSMNSNDADLMTIAISDEEFDAAVEQIDVSSDIPTVTEAYEVNGKPAATPEISVRGHKVNPSLVIQAYMYPEIIERSELSVVDKMIIRGVIKAIARKRQKQLGAKPKQKVLTNNQNKQAAFVDSILLSLLLGFFSGLLMTLIYITIKVGI